ncbi:hypothetical protein AMECASPLE_006142 [Ameca splendens]|uniref:Uncharacterized protein n=1 Tax=Ameca splendens TaxID=208324 RepID=A0ABV0YX94_9TELE
MLLVAGIFSGSPPNFTMFGWLYLSGCEKLTSETFLLTTTQATFGCSTKTSDLSHGKQVMSHLGMLVPKKLLLLTWRSTIPPMFTYWLSEMSAIQMERLCQHKPNEENRFERTWGPFLVQSDTNL